MRFLLWKKNKSCCEFHINVRLKPFNRFVCRVVLKKKKQFQATITLTIRLSRKREDRHYPKPHGIYWKIIFFLLSISLTFQMSVEFLFLHHIFVCTPFHYMQKKNTERQAIKLSRCVCTRRTQKKSHKRMEE